MKLKRVLTTTKIFLIVLLMPFLKSYAQESLNQTGAWYMYFYTADIGKGSWGIQGDLQFRNWNTLGDLEQLLVRSGITFEPEEIPIKFTLGVANITTGVPGESNETTGENRIYQEALISLREFQEKVMKQQERTEYIRKP